jgi:hypothetical protein
MNDQEKALAALLHDAGVIETGPGQIAVIAARLYASGVRVAPSPTEWSATCDWGNCDNTSVCIRLSTEDDAGWVAVCIVHATDATSDELAPMRDVPPGVAPSPTGCVECMGWPGHHSGCSKYGIPRTEAGARLLVTLENLIYRGGTIGDIARSDVVAIEDEAEVRAR